ncbi:MAG: GTP-binding protein [Candidatus Micrarchaeota archaeon]
MPVTIITGYLGSGKTTLLRRIADESGMRLAIIMNEFGEIAIDSKVVSGKNITMAELAGGCVCCSLSGEFSVAVAELLETAKPEWIVVETTGVAEPAALAYDIKENIPLIRLDSVVTVVDADSMARFPSLGHTGREQIELADIIIINKADLVTGEALGLVRQAVEKLNGRAAIMETERCGVETDALFGIARNRPAPVHKTHKVAFGYFDFLSENVLDHASLIRILETLPAGIYRAKGFARTNKGSFLVNYVAGRVELEEHACSKTELVFIGEGAQRSKDGVIRSFESASTP